MSLKGMAVALVSVALAAGPVLAAPSAGARSEQAGLWPTTFTSGQTANDCGTWRLDENGFCVANDVRNGLEVGTRFRTSTTVAITGVRIYRADPGSVRASLWTSDGVLLARGSFAAQDDNGWQDMSFADPVTIEPGQTYIASYFTPATKYAFDYGYFADSGRTVGPITALRAVDGSPNGVHCYQQDANCTYPVRAYKSSSYFVTPLWDASTTGPGPATGGDQPGSPRVTAITPTASSVRVAPRADIKVKFSEAVRRSTLTRATVRLLRTGSATPVAVAMRYDAKRHRLVLSPRAALLRGTTYRVRISTSVRDLAGHRLDQDPTRAGAQPATFTFRTRS